MVRWGTGICAALLLAIGPAQAQEPMINGAPAGSTAASDRISLDLKGVDILDVLKLLSQKSGLNFVAGSNVTGRVTIFVNDVPVWDAFELIISANELAYEQKGGIVTVMSARDYELLYGERFHARTANAVIPLKFAKGVQAATVLNQIKSSIGRVVVDETTNTLIVTDVPLKIAEMQEVLAQVDRPTKTRVFNLNHAEAEKLKEKMVELMSPVGTFTFDARTNKVVVSDLADVVDRIAPIVEAFDTPDGQVLIEAKIIKVELTDEMSMGIDWQQVFAGADLEARSNFRVLSNIVGGTATGGAMRLLSGQGDTQIVIEALKELTNTETLSNPRIMVSNNKEAKILVGTREAVVTSTTTVPATGSTVVAPEIQYVDVGTKLFVTPLIKPDGHIQMKIRPEVSSSTVEIFDDNRIPIVTSTEAETNVLVKSGSTLIIGGLIENSDGHTENKVPVLGDLPIVGNAFRGTTNTKTKTELVVFLTPQIILPDGTQADVPPSTSYSPVALREPVPTAYSQGIRQKLQHSLADAFRAASLPKGSAVVSFILGHDGHVQGDFKVSSPSGPPFIAAARSAVARAQPFPPFPEGSQASEVQFQMAVEYAPETSDGPVK